MINRHKSGQFYDTALTVAPLRGADNTINGYVGIQRDISQQKELDRLKDQFVSSVSHEFRAPLANMKLYLSLLESGRPEKRDQYLQTLQRETVRLENLIEDLLYISRLDMGAATTRRVPTELHPLIAQMITDRADLAARHGLSLDYLPKLDLPPALAEATMVTQVISNLMANAINYTPERRRGHAEHRDASGQSTGVDHDLGARHRAGHFRRRSASHLRAVLSGRSRAQIRCTRHRSGVVDLSAGGRKDGRPLNRREHTRTGRNVHRLAETRQRLRRRPR